ncbi:hypothetical protein MH050_03610 [Bacillus licheniformis]|nr:MULTISPECIES: hypothetical protein [Bacillus]MBU8787770.1 hypothetical protein [Bacillus glycinifermentans]MCA1181454.1 hypothetical protein [Bacillus licheniformis]MCM3210420.1 hypothetical protein [Bacillus licheniformis]MCM3286026.1 hypothetical protein [Bacillus licheniformis]MCY7739935.1 hypothetical protein [Bacillus licheniformis]
MMSGILFLLFGITLTLTWYFIAWEKYKQKDERCIEIEILNTFGYIGFLSIFFGFFMVVFNFVKANM